MGREVGVFYRYSFSIITSICPVRTMARHPNRLDLFVRRDEHTGEQPHFKWPAHLPNRTHRIKRVRCHRRNQLRRLSSHWKHDFLLPDDSQSDEFTQLRSADCRSRALCQRCYRNLRRDHVPNSGASAVSGWGWLARVSSQQIIDWIGNSSPPLRLTDIDVYSLNGQKYYSAVAVENTGNQTQGWWYYFNITAQEVTDALTLNDARLINLEIDTPPSLVTPARFTVVMVSSNPGGGWWYPGLSSSQVDSLLNQNGARLTCMERYTDAFGATKYAVAMVDNANAETRRVRDIIAGQMSNGTYGFKVKEVGGPVIASLNEDFAYEPASMLKILHGVYSIDRIAGGFDSLNNTLLNDDTCNPNECPDNSPGSCNSTVETVEQVLRRMFRVSDNNATLEIANRYGVTNLNNFAASFGLSNTHLNHTLGCLACGGPFVFNSFSARDAVDLYEMIADGTFFNQTWTDTLFSIMSNYNESGNSRLTPIINQEAALTNLTSSEIASFKDALNAANKGGSYTCGSQRWRTEGGWASIPFKSAGPIPFQFNREYAITAFIDNTTSTNSDQIYNDFWELIRTPLREALASWDAACGPISVVNHPQNASQPIGGTANFNVVTTGIGGGQTYRWQHLTGSLWVSLNNVANHYSGTTTQNLTISNIVASDETSYRCVITNVCSSLNSQPATLTIAASCIADLTGDGILNFFDVSAFLNAFSSNNPIADLTNDGVFNFFDVSAFLNAFSAGCP